MYEVSIMNRAERRLQQKIENKQAKKPIMKQKD